MAALRKLFASPGLGCRAYNLGTGTGQTVMEVRGRGGGHAVLMCAVLTSRLSEAHMRVHPSHTLL